jgi:hypothetical protein
MDIAMLVDMFKRMTKYDMEQFATMAVADGVGTEIEFMLHVAQLEAAGVDDE